MEIITRINFERKNAGKVAVINSRRLYDLALERSTEMVQELVPLDHREPLIPTNRISELAEIYFSYGEVIWANMLGEKKTLDIEKVEYAAHITRLWMESEAHKIVLLHNVFRYIGIAQANHNNNVVVTGIFCNYY